jgi:uncharacterized membrane protein YphA (DoxX/SURF4 family)
MRLAKALSTVFVGLLLLAAGVAKLDAPGPAVSFVSANLVRSTEIAEVMVPVIAAVEIIIGLWLLTFLHVRASRVVAASILTVFLVTSYMFQQSEVMPIFDSGCGCFGDSDILAPLSDYRIPLVLAGLIGLIVPYLADAFAGRNSQ